MGRGLCSDVMLDTKLDNKAKFLQMALESKARLESSVQVVLREGRGGVSRGFFYGTRVPRPASNVSSR